MNKFLACHLKMKKKPKIISEIIEGSCKLTYLHCLAVALLKHQYDTPCEHGALVMGEDEDDEYG